MDRGIWLDGSQGFNLIEYSLPSIFSLNVWLKLYGEGPWPLVTVSEEFKIAIRSDLQVETTTSEGSVTSGPLSKMKWLLLTM